MKEYDKYLKLLKEKYPTKQSVYRELINLNAIMNLPKGTEHFMSDLHGEYDAFYHIINNCSGVIKEKVAMLYGDELTVFEQQELCTLIYYPREKLSKLMDENKVNDEWYRNVLGQLIQIAKLLSSKYTRSKVRKAMPADFAYIIDELIHAQKDEDDNRSVYHRQIMETILSLHNGDEFLIALTDLIKRLAVDHLHILGDIYDRGSHADKILDLLMEHHSVDIQWGNHDILWMGAFCGNPVCMALVVRNNIKYKTMSILENGYGISLRFLLQFAVKTYSDKNVDDAVYKAISVILFKLEGQLIKRHPEYRMEGRLLLDKMDQGLLVPDELVVDLVVDRVNQDDCVNGYVLDGFPRTIPQAEALDKALKGLGQKIDYAINVEVPDENIVNRMSGRRACVDCGATYHIAYAPTSKEGICDKCGGGLILRDDDKPETVLKRLGVYHEQTQPLIDYYTEAGILKEVDGTIDINDVFAEIVKILGE